ncbi:hypothetical protein [Pseudomonas sp. FME51]|uniref:hypothetical protein n=1 Tax=Pseudomonas sp. FME51 TaxID=2742609 RepID=UPI001866C748|nr:hypothetical protein [Pseudomonas sp. FME51]
MKDFARFWWRASTFTVGVALSLIALCYLVRFYDYGLDFEDEYAWLFAVFFLIGFPTLLYGMKKLSEKS